MNMEKWDNRLKTGVNTLYPRVLNAGSKISGMPPRGTKPRRAAGRAPRRAALPGRRFGKQLVSKVLLGVQGGA